MGEASHLEKMGRELKCPICLGLLNSAVSLTCNHLFCNACIVKSMKTDATCPVCKVPYHRREVRAAPHMDSLVSIYRSMEVASGVSIFVSQNMPSSNKPSDEEEHVETNIKFQQDANEEIFRGTENRRISKRKGSKKTKESNVHASGPIVLKPSSQTKKRVQVPQHPSPENSTKSTKSVGGGGVEKSKDDIEKTLTGLKENPSPNKGGEQALSPFFWVRDVEDGENLSQLAEDDQLWDMTPLKVPSFSDLKDSDHESPSKRTEHEESNAKDMFDSEMFEWTQRPCSPEILPSPMKDKVQDIDELNRIRGRMSEVASSVKSTNEKLKAGSGRNRSPRLGIGVWKKVSKVSSPCVNIGNSQDRNGPSNKKGKGRQTNEQVKVKHAKRSEDQSSRVQAGLNKSEEADGKVCFRKMGRSKRTCSKTFEGRPTDVLLLGTEVLGDSEQNQVHGLSDAQPGKPTAADNPGTKKRESKSNANSFHPKDLSWYLRNQKLDGSRGIALEDFSKAERKTSKDKDTQNCLPFSSRASDMEAPVPPNQNPTKRATKLNPNLTSKPIRQSRCRKKMKASADDILGAGLTHDDRVGDAHASVDIMKSTENTGSRSAKVPEDLLTAKKPSLESSLPLRKCETVADKFLCSFCQSSEESEASGEMAHYCKGEPLSADCSGGSMVIHAHKNCTEWAPNVYFEDVTAINLEAELSRSRRITCSCCGLKGAALGCYYKSCKRSFHVPCAKLMPQCRWDLDNFVMLCPLHASSKLPCEETRPKQRKRKLTPKGQLCPQDNQIVAKGDFSALQSRSLHGLSKKLIFCCSGLTAEERNVVSEFAKLPGVTAFREWESNVTHVIASTNENGACKRTLKVLMGILEGKWILSMEWVKACMQNMKYIDEEQYEIAMDVHGIQDGPRFGRLRALNKQPKLFDGLKFYLMGDFEPAYKGYLQNLVVAAGGTILHRRPVSGQANQSATSSGSSTCVVYSLQLTDNVEPSKNEILSRRQSDAEALAKSAGARAVSNSWVLNSIAACKMQTLT